MDAQATQGGHDGNEADPPAGVAPASSALARLEAEIAEQRARITLDFDLPAQRVEAAVKALETARNSTLNVGVDETSSHWPIALGMGAFGLLLGSIAGLSKVQGISTTLLTGASSFVGGVLLTYVGFKRGPAGKDGNLDVERVGYSLLLFSLGVLIGVWSAASARHYSARQEAAEDARAAEEKEMKAKAEWQEARKSELAEAGAAAWTARAQWRDDVLWAAKNGQPVTAPPPAPSTPPISPPMPTRTEKVGSNTNEVGGISLENGRAAARCDAVRRRLGDKTYASAPSFIEADIADLRDSWCGSRPRPAVCAKTDTPSASRGVASVEELFHEFCH